MFPFYSFPDSEGFNLQYIFYLLLFNFSFLTLGVRRHSEKSPSSEGISRQVGMKAQPRTVVNILFNL